MILIPTLALASHGPSLNPGLNPNLASTQINDESARLQVTRIARLALGRLPPQHKSLRTLLVGGSE